MFLCCYTNKIFKGIIVWISVYMMYMVSRRYLPVYIFPYFSVVDF